MGCSSVDLLMLMIDVAASATASSSTLAAITGKKPAMLHLLLVNSTIAAAYSISRRVQQQRSLDRCSHINSNSNYHVIVKKC
jgi:hypothetical protein